MLEFWPDEKMASLAVTRHYGIEVDAVALHEASVRVSRYFDVKIQPAENDYMTDSQKAEYGAMIGGVLGIVSDLSYSLESYHQQQGSYSYYIYFVPCDWAGNVLDELVEVEFRVSEHAPNGGLEYSYNDRARTLFVGFRFNGREYLDADSMLDSVRQTMENIRDGEF